MSETYLHIIYRVKEVAWSCAGILLLAVVGSGCQQSASAPPLPNIIFIMADDLGYGDLGCYGQQVIETPEIDQMAREGIMFTQCYAGSPVCAPSRSVLMTGQHTGHTTVRGNFGKGGVVGLGGGKGRIPLMDGDTTIAEMLKGAGYTTAMIGKWGLGEPHTSGYPNSQGFDYFYGFANQRRAHSYFPDYIWENTEKILLPRNTDGAGEDYVHDRFAEQTIQYISTPREDPFFLYLPYTLPHDAYEIPDLGRFADSTHWSTDERYYAAMVTRLSTDVGRIFDALKAQGLDENTIVFFCSDNGAARRWEHLFDSSGSLRGQKRDMYEGGIRTPMIVRWPDKVPAGEVSAYPWYFADVLPTLAGIAGVTAPVSTDGADISRILLGAPIAHREEALYWEFYERGFQQAVRWKNWKAVLNHPDAEWELYDLSEDESEVHDIAGQYPEIVAQIIAIANTEHKPSPYYQAFKK